MQQTFIMSSMLALALAASGPVKADSVTGTEKQVDSVKCQKSTDPDTHEVSSSCHQVTTGSFSLAATISAQTFIANNISLADLNRETLITVASGGFDFSGTLADDAKSVRKPKLVKATWVASQHEVCTKTNKASGDCLKTKVVKDATVAINGDPNKKLTLKIQGKFDIYNEYGENLFAGACDDNGNGQMDADFVIGVGDATITKTLTVKCKVKYKTVDTPDDSFDLVNMAISFKAQ